MTRQEANEEITMINTLSLEKVQEMYNVDTKEEIIALIEEEIEEEEFEEVGNIYQENGFLSAYHCNAYLL